MKMRAPRPEGLPALCLTILVAGSPQRGAAAESAAGPTRRERRAQQKRELAPFQVTIRKQFSGPIKTVECLSPEWDDPLPVVFQESADNVVFTVPAFSRYALVVITQ